MLKAGDVDGYVSGACHSTANTLRPGLQVIKTAPGVKTVSSSFIMVADEKLPHPYNAEGVAVFADCAINIEPDAQQLADIAISSAQTAKNIVGIEPKVAMLSFSPKGSAKHESTEKVIAGYNIIKETHPEIDVDGELQLDASIVEVVGKQKAPESKVAGNANTLVFPNLDAGNIGYKLAQRFGNCMAIGPIMQGLALPLNDLSRGCVAEDIVAVAAISVLQGIK
jgi:phosphate acetyltransferase